MWEMTLRGHTRDGSPGVLMYEPAIRDLLRHLCDLVGPGQSEYHPVVAPTENGISAVCEFPGGAVAIDTYTSGKAQVEITASEGFETSKAASKVVSSLDLGAYTLGWAQSR